MLAPLAAFALATTALVTPAVFTPAWAQSSGRDGAATRSRPASLPTSAGMSAGAATAEAATLDTITITSTGASSGGPALPGTTTVTGEELERKNATDLRGVFAKEAAVKVGGSIPMTNKVYVHGIEETNLAISINGAQQNNKVFHHSGTTPIDPTFLKAVRVDAGIAPADSGPGALAGAIAYETKGARDFLDANGWGAFSKTTLSSNGPTFQQAFSAFARSGGFDMLGYFNIGKGNDYVSALGQSVPGTGVNTYSGLAKLGYETPGGDYFQFNYERMLDNAPRPFRANIGAIAGRPGWEPRVRDYKLTRDNVSFIYSRTSPDGWWDPKVVLAYNRTEIAVPIYARRGALIYPGAGVTDSINGRAENRFNFALGSVTAGVDFYRERAYYNDRDMATGEHRNNIGLYVQSRLSPWQRIRLSFGGRGDFQTLTGTTGQSFRAAGLSYNASGEIDLVQDFLIAKAGFSHVFGGMSLAENFILNPLWRYGDGPKAVTSDNVVAALEARYGGLSLEGRYFRTAIDNARAPAYAANLGVRTRNVLSQGFDVSARYTHDQTSLFAKYANIDVTIDGKPADADTGTYLVTPVGQIITLGASHQFAGTGLTLGGDMEIALPYTKVAQGSKPLPGYEVINLFAEYRPEMFRHLTLRADVKNLTNRLYSDRTTYGSEFGTVTPLYQPGRTFMVSAAARF